MRSREVISTTHPVNKGGFDRLRWTRSRRIDAIHGRVGIIKGGTTVKATFIDRMSGMKLTTLNYNGLYAYENQVTTINVNKIFKKSYTKFHRGSLTTAKRYHKVQCQNSPLETHLVEPRDILNEDSWQPLEGVVRCSVNYVPLSPISFLERAAEVYRNRISMIYGAIKYTWEETHRRCLKLASALNRLGVSRGDVVAVLSPNIPAMQELHFAIPMAGAIICPLNIRLDSNMISDLLKHSEAKILFVDYQLLQIAKDAINLLNNNTHSKPPLLFIISEPNYNSSVTLTHKFDYERLVESGDTEFSIVRPLDECDPISLNYTSGTTSAPKGVVYSHRGAYLNSLATVFIHGMREMPTYLWSLPMFHCNGWCFSWGTAVVGGTNVFLRRLNPKDVFDTVMIHKVTHMCGAPTILNMIVNYIGTNPKPLPHRVEIMTGGAPPPPTVLSRIEEIGFHVTHIYGLTETYGPGTWCLWKPEWDSLPIKEQGKLKARQGVIHFGMEEVVVKDPITMEDVKWDGKSVGEIMFRGNTVMNGYFKDVSATEKAFQGGWFRSGDLAIKHQDGYIEVMDRSKDIVISGGENISTIVVETAIYSHPGVLEVAVVARPHHYWGQTPCAFVKLKDGVRVDAQEIIQYCRDHMPHYMVPRTVVFDDLPRNSTGKVQKFVLRERAKNLGSVY